MLPEGNIRAIANNDLSALAKLGLDQAIALRAMAQDMGWVLTSECSIKGAATSYLADGTVFLDCLFGNAQAKMDLMDHAIAYARWSYAPAVTILADDTSNTLDMRGFVGLEPARLPPQLRMAAGATKVLMKRL